MKKSLLFVIIVLSCLSANAQEEGDTWVSVAKMNYVGIDDMPYENWYHEEDSNWGESNSSTGKVEIVSDGIAIINPCLQDEIWDNWAFVLANFPLEKGHDYIVRLTLKVPSDGAYYIELGSLNGEEVLSHQVSVKGSDTFQVIDVEYPEYKCCDAKDDGFVILGCGWVVGTTILKEVELLERTSTNDIISVKAAKGSNDTLYNLAGQKVDASYKGFVIQNGKKIMK